MKIFFDKDERKTTQIRYLYYVISALFLSIVNLQLLNLIEIGGLTPDFLLILVVWIALSEGQFTGLFFGFAIGLLFDVLSTDVIGTNALAKTVVAFMAGWFYKEGKDRKIIGSLRFLFIVFLCSIAHNLIYFIFYIKASNLDYLNLFLKYGVALSFYTTVFSVFGMLIKLPRKELIR